MKKTWIFIILGVLIATVIGVFLKAKSWGKSVVYGVANGVTIKNISFSGMNILLPIWIYNPAPINIILSNLDLKIYFNDYYVSKIQSPSNYQIKKKQNSTYPLMVNIDAKSTLKLLAEQGQIINEKDWLEMVNVKVIGTVTMDLGLVTITNFKINVEDSLKTYVV